MEHKESGVTFCLDATKCMFSSGNVTERTRMGRLKAAAGETVVDLFAGIGYYTLPLLAKAGAAKVSPLIMKTSSPVLSYGRDCPSPYLSTSSSSRLAPNHPRPPLSPPRRCPLSAFPPMPPPTNSVPLPQPLRPSHCDLAPPDALQASGHSRNVLGLTAVTAWWLQSLAFLRPPPSP